MNTIPAPVKLLVMFVVPCAAVAVPALFSSIPAWPFYGFACAWAAVCACVFLWIATTPRELVVTIPKGRHSPPLWQSIRLAQMIGFTKNVKLSMALIQPRSGHVEDCWEKTPGCPGDTSKLWGRTLGFLALPQGRSARFAFSIAPKTTASEPYQTLTTYRARLIFHGGPNRIKNPHVIFNPFKSVPDRVQAIPAEASIDGDKMRWQSTYQSKAQSGATYKVDSTTVINTGLKKIHGWPLGPYIGGNCPACMDFTLIFKIKE